MYTVKMLDKNSTVIFSQSHKELSQAVSVFEYWIKQDTFRKIPIWQVNIEYKY